MVLTATIGWLKVMLTNGASDTLPCGCMRSTFSGPAGVCAGLVGGFWLSVSAGKVWLIVVPAAGLVSDGAGQAKSAPRLEVVDQRGSRARICATTVCGSALPVTTVVPATAGWVAVPALTMKPAGSTPESPGAPVWPPPVAVGPPPGSVAPTVAVVCAPVGRGLAESGWSALVPTERPTTVTHNARAAATSPALRRRDVRVGRPAICSSWVPGHVNAPPRWPDGGTRPNGCTTPTAVPAHRGNPSTTEWDGRQTQLGDCSFYEVLEGGNARRLGEA